jgi:hypothetical protein
MARTVRNGAVPDDQIVPGKRQPVKTQGARQEHTAGTLVGLDWTDASSFVLYLACDRREYAANGAWKTLVKSILTIQKICLTDPWRSRACELTKALLIY